MPDRPTIGPGANLRYANLWGATLRGAVLRGADLRDAYLRDANLYVADLRDANLYGAVLRYADLRYANLYGADLRYADLRGASLRDAFMPNGRRATDLVLRLARAGACADAIVWASNLNPECSWRTAWQAARTDWQEFFGEYDDAVEDLLKREGDDA